MNPEVFREYDIRGIVDKDLTTDFVVDLGRAIGSFAAARGAKVVGRIPFDRTVNDSLMAGKTVVDFGDSPARTAMLDIHRALRELLERD